MNPPNDLAAVRAVRILRKTSLDELPQVKGHRALGWINQLRWDRAFVSRDSARLRLWIVLRTSVMAWRDWLDRSGMPPEVSTCIYKSDPILASSAPTSFDFLGSWRHTCGHEAIGKGRGESAKGHGAGAQANARRISSRTGASACRMRSSAPFTAATT